MTRWWIEHDVLGRRRTARDEHGDVYDGRYGAHIVDTYTGATDVSTVDPADAGAEGTYRCELNLARSGRRRRSPPLGPEHG